MAREKNKEKAQEDGMLTTENAPNAPEEPNVDEQPDEVEVERTESKERIIMERVLDRIAEQDDRIMALKDDVSDLEKKVRSLRAKKEVGDAGYLVNPFKVMAGLALSADELSTFKQTFPYLF